MNKAMRLILSVMLSLSAGFIGSFFTRESISTWYAGLLKPSFNPPDRVFGPVWTILYVLMGISFFFLWERKAKKAMSFFMVQLALNTLWSIIFFGAKEILLAFIEIIALWAAINLTIYYSYREDRRAAYLLVPYMIWVSFAAVLNYSIYMLNI